MGEINVISTSDVGQPDWWQSPKDAYLDPNVILWALLI